MDSDSPTNQAVKENKKRKLKALEVLGTANSVFILNGYILSLIFVKREKKRYSIHSRIRQSIIV